MACTDRFSFRAIDGLSRPDASNVKSCASSAGVHGRPVGRGPSFIWLSPSAPALQAGGSNQSATPGNLSQGKPQCVCPATSAKVVRFRASAIVSTLFAFRTSARSLLARRPVHAGGFLFVEGVGQPLKPSAEDAYPPSITQELDDQLWYKD